jgi:hypothetical protein
MLFKQFDENKNQKTNEFVFDYILHTRCYILVWT